MPWVKSSLDPRDLEVADAIITIYSVIDRNSFHLVRELLDWMTDNDEDGGTGLRTLNYQKF